MIRIEDLEVRRNGGAICALPALTVETGERLAIIGANGSGKTTLLTVLAGLDERFSGTCQVDLPVEQRIYVHQQPYLFRGSVEFNVAYGLRARGTPRAIAKVEAARWLATLGIADHGLRQVDNLSGGERRRVALARALAVRPALLLLDEPLADLDASGIALLREALAGLAGTTILFASPSPLPEGFARRQLELTRPAAV